MKILVTGGTGYIGSHTVVELIEAGHTVEIVDNLYNSEAGVVERIERITGVKPQLREVDLLDYDALLEVMKEGGFEAVMHFAGLKAVAESVEKPLEYYENNIGGTINLLKAMRECGVKKLVFSSSATVYGVQESPKYVETMVTGGQLANPYGRTKYMIEEILKDVAAADSEMEITLLRYFNPIGAHESGLIGENPKGRPNNLMPIVLKVAAGEILELTICGDDYPTPDGTCRRDYIHVVDLAKGHLAALEKMRPGVQIYNLGAGEPVSVKEIVAAFEAASGEALPCAVGEKRAGDLPEFYADPSLSWVELGWKTERTVDDAMRDSLRFLRGGDVL